MTEISKTDNGKFFIVVFKRFIKKKKKSSPPRGGHSALESYGGTVDTDMFDDIFVKDLQSLQAI